MTCGVGSLPAAGVPMGMGLLAARRVSRWATDWSAQLNVSERDEFGLFALAIA